jgi:hypothetical protein
MRGGRRRQAAATDALLSGYVSGPAAATEATIRALGRLAGARRVILVEGISDQIAVEAVAERGGTDIAERGIVVVPMGGIHALPSHLRRMSSMPTGTEVVGLYDVGEAAVVGRALGCSPARVAELGFHACVEDLEDELIGAVGVERVVRLIEAHGDGRPFRTLQRQDEWRDRPLASQVRRFIGSGARRKLRYARVLGLELAPERVPVPLRAVLHDD